MRVLQSPSSGRAVLQPFFNLFRRRSWPDRDLFGRRILALPPEMAATDTMILELRALAEDAFRAGLDRSSCLIELASLMIELEAASLAQDEVEL